MESMIVMRVVISRATTASCTSSPVELPQKAEESLCTITVSSHGNATQRTRVSHSCKATTGIRRGIGVVCSHEEQNRT